MSNLVRFGPGHRLTGILTRGEAASNSPVLLLPSAGLQPRSGPFRLHVELAERLSARGISSFRFDVPGVGEAPRLDGCDAHAALLSAMDCLENLHACKRFAAGGVCSAADTGWRAALADKRVTALLMLDGISFLGPWFHYARNLDRLRRLPRDWKRMARRLPSRLRDGDEPGSVEFRDWPSHAEAREQFAGMAARGVHMLFIYSGGYTDRFLHKRQFRWTFGPASNNPAVSLKYWPDCDHTYFARAHRERLVCEVTDWMASLPAGGAT